MRSNSMFQNITRRSAITAAIIVLGALSGVSAQAETGMTSTEIKIGTVLDLTGSNKATGQSLLEGMKSYVDKVNSAGGVNGRKIEIISYDDGYDPKQTYEATKKLIEKDKVFALSNYLGTTNIQLSLPLILKESVPIVGSRTGAEFLRAPLKRPVFNVRASYFKEVDALVEHLTKKMGAKNIAVLHQNDSFGDAGKIGLERALQRRGMKSAGSFSYDKSDASNIDAAYAQIKAVNPDAVIMATIASTATAFVKKASNDKLGAKLAGISSVGSNFVKELKAEETEGVIVSGALPEPSDSSLKIVSDFKADMSKSGYKNTSSVAFEGYFNAVILVEGIKAGGANLTRDSFVKGLEGLDKTIGGIKVNYSESDHEATNDIYISKVFGGKISEIK